MRGSRIALGLVAGTLAWGCAAEPEVKPEGEAAGVVEEAGPAMAKPPEAWVAERVARAKARLEASEAGRLVWASMEAHGGLERWFSAGPIAYRFTYAPVGGKGVRDSHQVIDTWSSRARHWLPGDASKGFGWDGERAWATAPDEELGVKPRFWSLTPYYFVAVPFVFGDDGVNLEAEGEAEFEGKTYDLVRVTFEAGTGDAPDDFYVLYVERETRRVGGVRYVVSYPGFFPEGGHSPEKFMKYDGAQEVDGIVLPETFRTFKWTDGAPGELVTNSKMTDVSFEPGREASWFEAPEGARVIDGM
jgi:hypothetical protein